MGDFFGKGISCRTPPCNSSPRTSRNSRRRWWCVRFKKRCCIAGRITACNVGELSNRRHSQMNSSGWNQTTSRNLLLFSPCCRAAVEEVMLCRLLFDQPGTTTILVLIQLVGGPPRREAWSTRLKVMLWYWVIGSWRKYSVVVVLDLGSNHEST